MGLAAIMGAGCSPPAHRRVDLGPRAWRGPPRRRRPTDGLRAVERTLELTDGLGADVAIEAVAFPRPSSSAPPSSGPAAGRERRSPRPPGDASPGGPLDQNVTITTGLVDTPTPRLIRLVQGASSTRRSSLTPFPLEETIGAYEVFADAGANDALKIVLDAQPVPLEPETHRDLVTA